MTQDVQGEPAELSLLDLLRLIARRKLVIGTFVAIGIACGAAYAFLATPKYRADVVFAPAQDSGGGLGQLAGDLGGLAALAGINIGGGGSQNDEALETLRSRAFTAAFIQRHDLMPKLFAKDWDASRKAWLDPDPANHPTLAEAVEKFSSDIRSIGEDRRTGIVTVSIVWRDRNEAATWANMLVAEADVALRERNLKELARSIDYLKGEAANTSVVEVRQTIYRVMETQLKNSMLARTRDSYAFRVIDPAVPPDPKDRVSPKRALSLAIGLALGLVVGVLVAVALQLRARPARAA